KLPSSPAIQFKGSGWYITDYAKKSGADSGKPGDTPASKPGTDSSSTSSSTSSSSSSPSSGSDTPAAKTTPKERLSGERPLRDRSRAGIRGTAPRGKAGEARSNRRRAGIR